MLVNIDGFGSYSIEQCYLMGAYQCIPLPIVPTSSITIPLNVSSHTGTKGKKIDDTRENDCLTIPQCLSVTVSKSYTAGSTTLVADILKNVGIPR